MSERKRAYLVQGIREVRFEVEVEAENGDEAMRLVDIGRVAIDSSDYIGNVTAYAESAELND